MVFTSLAFILFFLILYILYYLTSDHDVKYQNIILLIGSYFFYSWSNWKLTIIIFLISIFIYFLGIFIDNEKSYRKKNVLKNIGVLQGVGALVYFKYTNFFVATSNSLFKTNFTFINLIVPLGISFFTFRTLSYIIDVYKGKINATNNLILFLNYVAFFPTILSGPIDKPSNFIPQLESTRKFDLINSKNGLRQILWGLFKKIVIANNLTIFTNVVFSNYNIIPASSLLIGTFSYAIQMYADFSGYTDIAIGISKLLNINIAINFNYPFFSENVAEYWRKWHISLTSWLTEYVFTPLSISFRNFGKFGLILAIVINFTICGIWHGANWTYILFGFLHGCYFIPLIIKGSINKKHKFIKGQSISLNRIINIIITFIIISLTFIVFRSNTINDAINYYKNLFSITIFKQPYFPGIDILKTMAPIYILTTLFIIVEWIGKYHFIPLDLIVNKFNKTIRWSIYYLIIIIIIYFAGAEQEFIYIQF